MIKHSDHCADHGGYACSCGAVDEWKNHRMEDMGRKLAEAVKFIRATPHGDNCFVSNHSEGDPGNRCNCGKDAILEWLDGDSSAEPSQGKPTAYIRRDQLQQAQRGAFLCRVYPRDEAPGLVAIYTEQPAPARGDVLNMVLETLDELHTSTRGTATAGDAYEAIYKLQSHPAQAGMPEGFVWPSPPKRRGQSPVLFDDGYEEGWAKAIDTVKMMLSGRPCTCHPDDNPPRPCTKQYSLSECRAAAPAASVPVQAVTLTDEQKTELLDWASACQSAYHIDNTPGHRFGGIGSNLQDNRDSLVEYVESLLSGSTKTGEENGSI